MRIVHQKGIGEKGEMQWLIKDLHEELKSWGRPGGPNSRLMMRSDSERPMVARRAALAKMHGGLVTPGQPPKASQPPMAEWKRPAVQYGIWFGCASSGWSRSSKEPSLCKSPSCNGRCAGQRCYCPDFESAKTGRLRSNAKLASGA